MVVEKPSETSLQETPWMQTPFCGTVWGVAASRDDQRRDPDRDEQRPEKCSLHLKREDYAPWMPLTP